MPSLSPFDRLGAILARAKSLIAGDEGGATPTRMEEARSAPDLEAAPEVDAGSGWELVTQDKSFWATMAGADRRLAELRRVIDQAAAEAIEREAGVEAPSRNGPDPSLGMSRCKMANRVITDALGRGDPDPPLTG